MSQTCTSLLEKSYYRGLELTAEAINNCPDELWEQTIAGYPVWQQIYHSIALVHIFLRLPDEETVNGLLIGLDKARLTTISDHCEITRNEMLTYIEATVVFAKKFFNRCDDSILDDPFPYRDGFTYGGILARGESHLFYHLGCIDAVLRENGHQAAW